MTMLWLARRIIALTAIFFLVSASPAAADSEAADIVTPLITGFLASLTGSLLAQEADPDGDYGRPGFYLGAGVMRAYNLFEEELPPGVKVDNSFGINSRVGYRIFSRLALEAEFEWVNEFGLDANDNKILGIETLTGTANVKGFLFTGPFQPYALFGVGVMNASEKDSAGLSVNANGTDLTFRMGGGFDFWANEKFAIALEATYLRPRGGLKDFDYVSYTVAAQYRF
jgi:opacity protein-like surface antigen